MFSESPVAGMTLRLGILGSQQHWIEMEHWQTQHLRHEQVVQHSLCLYESNDDIEYDVDIYLRHAIITIPTNRDRRLKEIIFPNGSEWNTLPLRSMLSWQRPWTFPGIKEWV